MKTRTPFYEHHLTSDDIGQVFWKDQFIGKFGNANCAFEDHGKAIATALAIKCRELEACGRPVNQETVLEKSQWNLSQNNSGAI